MESENNDKQPKVPEEKPKVLRRKRGRPCMFLEDNLRVRLPKSWSEQLIRIQNELLIRERRKVSIVELVRNALKKVYDLRDEPLPPEKQLPPPRWPRRKAKIPMGLEITRPIPPAAQDNEKPPEPPKHGFNLQA